ncbi:hypothetical protein OF83DRAFT_1140557 [Amylostereum chailletii]|nr:hypothetical protein OF83DRAFT_1140557 [Amylostereum chailletii]
MAEDLRFSITPVHRVPAEILLEILGYLHLGSHPSSGNPCQDAISVSQVCRRWRAAALQCREIWSVLPMKPDSRWTKAAIERSGTYPLTVDLPHDSSYTQSQWEDVCLVLAELPRIRKLSITFIEKGPAEPAPKMAEATRLLRDTPATMLEDLKISTTDTQYIRPAYYHLFSRTVPQKLRSLEAFGIDFAPDVLNASIFPDLRHLTLNECKLRRDHFLLRSPLTHLDVMRCEIWDEGTFEDLLEALSLVPTLETMKLRCTLNRQMAESWMERPSSSELAPIPLPNLQSLHIQESYVACLGLLCGLSLPMSAAVKADALMHWDYIWTEDPAATLHRTLSSYYAPADAAGMSFSSARIRKREDVDNSLPDAYNSDVFTFLANGTRVRGPSGEWTDVSDDVQNGGSPGLGNLQLSLLGQDVDDDPDLLLPLAYTFFTLPVFQHLRTLYVHHSAVFITARHWFHVFSALQSVVDLTVEDCVAYGLVSAFNDTSRPQLFPKLEQLRFYDVEFLPEYRNGSDMPFFVLLQTGLLARASDASVAPLRLLEINNCAIGERLVGVLKKMFGDIVQVDD